MLFKKLSGYIKGYVIFSAEGVRCEELITDCIASDIQLKNIITTNFGFTAVIFTEDYRHIARTARRLGMRTAILEKHGAGFLIFRNRKRWGIIAGLFIILLLLHSFDSRLWNIEIKGCETIPEEIILSNLKNKGYYIGAKLSDIDSLKLERELSCEISGIGLAAINFDGSKMEVIIEEIHNPKYIIDDEKRKYNVIATESGQVTYTEVYEGEPAVKKGDTVQKGDLLISGVFEGKTGKLHFENASGKILASVEETLTEQVDFNQTDCVFTDKMHRCPYLQIGGRKLRFSLIPDSNEDFIIYEKSKPVTFFGANMPVRAGVEIRRYTKDIPLILSREEAKAICIKNMEDREKDIFRNCRIIERKLICHVSMKSFILEGRYLVEKDIGRKQEYFVEIQ